MYRVTIINNGIETQIHNSYVNDLKLSSGTIKTEINAIDSFVFSLYMNNPGFNKIKPLKTLVLVLNTRTGKYEFEGRVLAPSEDMDNSGLHSMSYECEGELGYLHDSQQRHLEYRGTPRDLLQTILDYHNSQVEEYKRFYLGEMNVTNSTDNLYLYLSAEKTTFDTIKEKLIDNLGGELQIRKVDGVRFLDYLQRVGEDKETEIKLAKNLISISRDVDPTQIITRLTPLGTRIESDDEDATDASEARLTIESVNGDLPYIDAPLLIEEFGIQGGSITWDDINFPSILLSRGQEWLANQKISHNQYKISTLDLFLIGLDIDSFSLGNSYPVINSIMSINERLRVIGKSLDINTPQNTSLTIGDKFKTLNEYQNDLNKSAQQVVDLQGKVNRQSQTITTIKNQMESVEQTVEAVKIEIENSDLPALEEAIENLNSAVDNLIEAIDEIPIYEPATQTIDGLMSAQDKVKIDNLKNYSVATVNKDGLMSANDKAKSDLISVISPIDLDDILARLEALENGTTDIE